MGQLSFLVLEEVTADCTPQSDCLLAVVSVLQMTFRALFWLPWSPDSQKGVPRIKSMSSLVTEQAAFIPPVLSLGSSILMPHHWVWSVLRGWPLSECPDPAELLDSPEAWTMVIALNSSLGGAA